jgi:hypothetical protein
MEDPIESDGLKEKVKKIVQAEDVEEGTIVQTHLNYPLGLENADPDYFTKLMTCKKEDLISTQEMSRILGTTFTNSTIVQQPNPSRVAPKSPAFKKHYMGTAK